MPTYTKTINISHPYDFGVRADGRSTNPPMGLRSEDELSGLTELGDLTLPDLTTYDYDSVVNNAAAWRKKLAKISMLLGIWEFHLSSILYAGRDLTGANGDKNEINSFPSPLPVHPVSNHDHSRKDHPHPATKDRSDENKE